MVTNKSDGMGRVVGIVRAEGLRPQSQAYEVIYGRSEHEGKADTAGAIAGALKYLDSYTEQLQSEGFIHVRVTHEDVLAGSSMTVITEHAIEPYASE
tara:strand:- start:9670 stop:9960 length:291 start_codon:yes stop_codon:yes gene_type:complete